MFASIDLELSLKSGELSMEEKEEESDELDADFDEQVMKAEIESHAGK